MALVTLTKIPLFIWSRRRSCKILRGFGAISLILLMRSNLIIEIDEPPEPTPEFGQRSRPWPVLERRSYRLGGRHASGGFPPSLLKGTP